MSSIDRRVQPAAAITIVNIAHVEFQCEQFEFSVMNELEFGVMNLNLVS